jgi:hypothetical protein
MMFINDAERDLSSSPLKTGGASHRRILVHIVELLKTTGNLKGYTTTLM